MAAGFLDQLLGRRAESPNLPNTLDSGSRVSIAIAEAILLTTDCPRAGFTPPSSPGGKFEKAIAEHLEAELTLLNSNANWDVRSAQNPITAFSQYQHLKTLKNAIDADTTGTLRVAVGSDYLISPDVTIGRGPMPHPLHASVSCKWTLRSDRAQNARTEARGLIAHRKGRVPHIVLVTAEPLPSRLASLGFGTGDIDALYHVTYPELIDAVEQFGTDKEKQNLSVLVQGDRLRDYADLASVLAS